MSSGIDKKRVKTDDIACGMCLFGGENEKKRGKSQNKRKFHDIRQDYLLIRHSQIRLQIL